MQLQIAKLLKNIGKNNSTKKKTTNKATTTLFFNRGLRRFFQDKNGFFIYVRTRTVGKNGKMQMKAIKKYLPGLFYYKNYGNRIARWQPNR